MGKSSLYLDFDYDFVLFSIISSIKDYRLCWQLNNMLHFNFVRQEDIEIHDKKKRQLAYFNLFQFDDEINFMEYFFISNKSSGIFFIPELKQVDHFLMIRGNDLYFEKKELLNKIKGLQAVEVIFETNPQELKSRQNLIFE